MSKSHFNAPFNTFLTSGWVGGVGGVGGTCQNPCGGHPSAKTEFNVISLKKRNSIDMITISFCQTHFKNVSEKN